VNSYYTICPQVLQQKVESKVLKYTQLLTHGKTNEGLAGMTELVEHLMEVVVDLYNTGKRF